MTSVAKLRIALFGSLCWAAAAFGVSIAPIFSDTDFMASESAYHDIRHLLAETPPHSGTESETMAYFDRQSILLNWTRLWHATTALLLATVSAVALKRARGDPDTGYRGAPHPAASSDDAERG